MNVLEEQFERDAVRAYEFMVGLLINEEAKDSDRVEVAKYFLANIRFASNKMAAINIMVECFKRADTDNKKMNIAYDLYTLLSEKEFDGIDSDYKQEIRDVAISRAQTVHETEINNQINSQERRHQKNQDYSLTYDEWRETLKCFENKCAYCGGRGQMTYEHFVPFSKGGLFTKWNIIPACQKCNGSKRDKDFKEWYKGQEFYDSGKEAFILNYVNRG